MIDFAIEQGGLFKYLGDGGEVITPDGVELISEEAFKDCENVTSVVFSDSVTCIEENVFGGCTNLKSVFIPYSVTEIGDFAFGDSGVESITVDRYNSVYTDIDGNLYSKDRTELIQYAIGKKDTSFTVPSGVASIHEETFFGCTSLREVIIPDGVTKIGGMAFANCMALERIILPDTVKTVGDSAFCNCPSLKEVIIPNGVTTIHFTAFRGCTGLTSIFIPESVMKIGDMAFGENEFTEIRVDENNPCYTDIDGVLYSRDKTRLIQYACGKRDASYAIPDGVTKIDSCAFYNCKSLVNVFIPDSVTDIGWLAFDGCTSLSRILCSDRECNVLGDQLFKLALFEKTLSHYLHRLKRGNVTAEEEQGWNEVITQNIVPTLTVMKNDLSFYQLAIEKRWLKKECVDEVLFFTDSLECRTRLIEYKNGSVALNA